MSTISEIAHERGAQRREESERALRAAVLEVLSTKAGRKVWLWIRDEVCRAGKRAPAEAVLARFEGRRDVGLDLDTQLVEFPEIRMALAQDRAAMETDQARYEALVHKEREAKASDGGNT